MAAHGEQQEHVDLISLFASAAETSKRESNNDDLLIVKSGFPRPKERFLDRLAELFTLKKKASFVTATTIDKLFCKVCALRRTLLRCVPNQLAKRDHQILLLCLFDGDRGLLEEDFPDVIVSLTIFSHHDNGSTQRLNTTSKSHSMQACQVSSLLPSLVNKGHCLF